MILGMGTDIADCERVWRISQRFGQHFMDNILTPAEQSLLESRKAKAEFLGGRWAAKEAFAKALGCGMCEECAFKEIEILNTGKGMPAISLHAETARTAERMGVKKIHVSISHEKQFAVATVILEGCSPD